MTELEIFDGVEAVIFDLDGTLVDSMWIWPAVDVDYFEKYHLDVPDGFYNEMEGRSYSELAKLFYDTFPTLNRTIDEIKNEWHEMAYDKYIHEVTVKPGAVEMIRALQKKGIKCGIATSNSKELADAVLEARNIRYLFDSIHTACEVTTGKPAPDVYLLVAEDLKVDAEKCFVFEDIPKGILAGKAAGMRVCAIDDETSRSQDKTKRELADYYIRDFYDIINSTYEVL